MKSLAELSAIRDKMKSKVALREETGEVAVTQTGCIGICRYEPIVEVYRSGEEKVTYIKMTADKAKEVMEKHIKGGKPVVEYTIGNIEK